METNNFFWLHIKKCGGQSFRKTFTPPYVQTDRRENFKPFVALPRKEWNDALNNYRIPLGEYDYKRMLFAKNFLLSSSEFSTTFKFVIVRNPYERIISAWKYLLRRNNLNLKTILCEPKKVKMKYSFKYFLTNLPTLWEDKHDRHMATHTAPIWDDITDNNHKLLVDYIVKLDNINEGLKYVCENTCLDFSKFKHTNKNREKRNYRKFYTSETKSMVDTLYSKDIRYLDYTF